MKRKISFFSLLFFIALLIQANKINIPADYGKIQEGIDHALTGDTVLVSPGTYLENICFKGKNIVVASHFILEGNTEFINTTIIDGSMPLNPDTASCVTFANGEDSTAVIEGFTLTKGKGTRYLYPNGWFREGGGVFVETASPTIKSNLIIGNEVLNGSNVTSAGGGGIRSNLGKPHIYNNVLMLNKAFFGAAVVLDNSNGIIKNNIIYMNTGATEFGGGGAFWVYGPGCWVVIENNTIAANSIGGLYFQASKVLIANNIIWGNNGYQIGYGDDFGKSELTVESNDIQGGYNNNISLYPLFADTAFFLAPSSPVIDSGMANETYNDIDDPMNPGSALWPSEGAVRNDIGAYGGPNAAFLPSFEFYKITAPSVNFGNNNTIGIPFIRNLMFTNQSTASLHIDSTKYLANSQVVVKSISDSTLMPLQTAIIPLEWTPQNDLKYTDTLFVYHNLNTIANPVKVFLSGQTRKVTGIDMKTSATFIEIYPNPFNETAIFHYKGVVPNSLLNIFDIQGKSIRSIKIENTEGTVSVSRNEMPVGIYIYMLKTEKTVLTGKFVIID
jgi:hypothetical protein